MTILRIEVCQKCHEVGKPIKKYRLGDAEHLFRFPLCIDCLRTPLAELLDLEPRRKRAPNVPKTMADVAAAKKASNRRRKPTVKRTR